MSETEARAGARRLGYIGRKPGAAAEPHPWQTPVAYVDTVREVLSRIDLDPYPAGALPAEGLARLKAIAPATDDHARDFRVWMTPPFSGADTAAAVVALLDRIEVGAVGSAIVLLNNNTETRWFQSALAAASAMCLTNRRVPFTRADKVPTSGSTRGQVFLYFGRHPEVFVSAFATHGTSVVLGTGWTRHPQPAPATEPQPTLF